MLLHFVKSDVRADTIESKLSPVLVYDPHDQKLELTIEMLFRAHENPEN